MVHTGFNAHRKSPAPRAAPAATNLMVTVMVDLVAMVFVVQSLAACKTSKGPSGGTNANVNTSIDPTCTTVRVTHYSGGPRGWCEFSRNLPILPDFVRNGMTLAIAEPWNGGSYGGASGEACGECWEVSSSWDTQILMVTDLCPIKGNPICAGGHFHFDLAAEAAQALQTKGLDAASARRVPCPVSGNIYVVANDWNQWGYMRVAFVNLRIPLREAWVRAAPDGDWRAFERSSGAWQISNGPRPEDGNGVLFRLRSAQGQMVESDKVVPFHIGISSQDPALEDMGAQFDDQSPDDTTCPYLPPGLVYGDGYGGIDQLRWQPNPWGDATISESHENCHLGSASCLKIDHLGNWNGFHIYYYPTFPTDTFSKLVVWGRTSKGEIQVHLGPGHEGDTCADQDVTFSTEWTQVTFDVAQGCGSLPTLSAVTLQSGAQGGSLFLDDIEFQP
ncbi:MAG: hypothetical protein J7M25_17120 [Deltaproteobacteria bacterium]|nr:hypothetical protein [Deltaproteobacteria bacterium]